MKRTLILFFFLTLAVNFLFSQTVTHPWHAVDNGGGKSFGSGLTLHGSIGQPAIAAMTGSGLTLESGYIPGARQMSGTTTASSVLFEQNWNMVSVPLKVLDYSKTALFPSAVSGAFAYSSGYQSEDTLKFGIGYWLKFGSTESVPFSGSSTTTETVDVADKWNMVGCISFPVEITNIGTIGTTLASSFFGFNNATGYQSEVELLPGRAYWIKVSGAGKLILRTGSELASSSPSSVIMKGKSPNRSTTSAIEQPEGIYVIRVTDALKRERKVFFSSARSDIDLAMFELPPVPPAGLDIRFASQRSLEVVTDMKTIQQFPLNIRSAKYPLTFNWDVPVEQGTFQFVITTEEGTTERINLTETNTYTIEQEPASIKLRMGGVGANELPKEFALHQNYPNPFNPLTVIRYSLPVDSWVTLKIYNLLGEEVATLIDGVEVAGYRLVKWDASSFPSGVYLYKISAGNFSQVRKMILLR